MLPNNAMNDMATTNESIQNFTDQQGILPPCAPLSVPYVPFQKEGTAKYAQKEGLQNGTLFPGLHLPFHLATTSQPLPNTALAELMALEFAIVELGLYLDTHSDDTEAFELYKKYVALEKEGRKRYIAIYGPIMQTETASMKEYTWVKDPWPWDLPEGKVK